MKAIAFEFTRFISSTAMTRCDFGRTVVAVPISKEVAHVTRKQNA